MDFLVHCCGVVDGRAAFWYLKVEHWFRSCLSRGGTKRDVSALNHETGDKAVEWSIVVRATCAESEEVLCGLRDCFAEKLDLEVALSRMQLFRQLSELRPFA